MNTKSKYAFLISYSPDGMWRETKEAEEVVIAEDVLGALDVWKRSGFWQPILSIKMLHHKPVRESADLMSAAELSNILGGSPNLSPNANNNATNPNPTA